MSSKPKTSARSSQRSGSTAVTAGPGRVAPGQRVSVRWTPLFVGLLACFTLSGMTGLVYQVLWGRLLTLVFGATAAATGTVLAVFMGGLALGGWLAGRRADSLARPLRWYGLLEGGIGLCALLVPLVFAAAVPLYRWGWRATGGSAGALLALRLLLSCIALLPPTTLMGATLPVLSRLCATRRETLGAQVGTLYGANTLGAAAGAFLAGFLLIPALGVTVTIWLTACVNFLLMGAALLLEKRFAEPSGDVQEEPPVPVRRNARAPAPELSLEEEAMHRRQARIAMLGFGISGAIALVYEVAWTRALLLVIGSNIYAFAAMLTTFLVGLFVGTLSAARVADRLRHPLTAFAWMEAGVGVAAWVGFLCFDSLPWISFTQMNSLPQTAGAALLARFGLAALVMLPSALCLGALFPLAVRACGPTLERVGRAVGDLYAGNTLGAIGGALLASFVLLPLLGTQMTLHVAMAGNLLLACVFYAASLPRPFTPAASAARWAGLAFPVLLIVVAWPIHWDDLALVMTQPTRRALAHYLEKVHEMPYASQADFLDHVHKEQQLLFHAEGRSSHVAVIHNELNTSLLTNGHADGSDNEDMPTQILLGAVPMLLHPRPADVAVVGWGTGVTLGVAEDFSLQHLTALELEPQVLNASKFFHHVNHAPERDPRLNVRLEDGRNFFLTSDQNFDVIVSEPSNVWQAGVCNLFTRDYFRLCRARLRPDGLFTQWLGYGAVPTQEVRGILSALREVFPNALLFRIDEHDALIIASGQPLKIDAARLQAAFQSASAPLQNDLQRAGISDAPHLIARLRLGTDELPAFCQNEMPNTDDNARLEFATARAYEMRFYSEEGQAAFAAVRPADPFKYVSLAGFSPAEQETFRQKVLAALAEPEATKQ